MYPSRPTALERFFAGVTEYTFHTRLGVTDTSLVDYISDLLTRFSRLEVLHRVRDIRGKPLIEVVDMMIEAEHRQGDAKRDVHRHIGDFTLFWTGVFPETLARRKESASKDHLIDYREQGKRAYWIASTIPVASEESASNDVLERLSRHFELCEYGLREIRREWERREGDDELPRPFLIN